MPIDFEALASELDDADGPMLGDVLAERARNDLMVRALQALAEPRQQPAPQVVVNPEIKVPEAQVVVQPAQSKLVSWTFEFERNADGTIKCIHATPKE